MALFHCVSAYKEKKKEVKLSHMTIAPIPQENKKVKRQHKDATKTFGYTTIAIQLVLLNRFGLRDPNLPTNCKSCEIKWTYI